MEITTPKTFVFVLMPFNETFNDIYELGIKAACKEVGAYCERVDEQIFDESILERVFNQITKADVLIAEMTGRNPNVFYETGYAHALNKRVILLTQNADDIPFDLKHFPHIVYSGKIRLLKSELERRIRWCIENPKESLSKVDFTFEFFMEGKSLMEQPEIHILYRKDANDREAFFAKKIDIHNMSNRVIHPNSYSLAIELPETASINMNDSIASVTKMPSGRTVYNLEPIPTLFPNAWHSQPFRFYSQFVPFIDATIHLYTELGSKEFAFTFKLQKEEQQW